MIISSKAKVAKVAKRRASPNVISSLSKILISSIFTVILSACGGSEEVPNDNITQTNLAPVITFTAPEESYFGDSVNISWAASDPEGDTITEVIDIESQIDLDHILSTGNLSFEVPIIEYDTVIKVTIKVEDDKNNSTVKTIELLLKQTVKYSQDLPLGSVEAPFIMSGNVVEFEFTSTLDPLTVNFETVKITGDGVSEVQKPKLAMDGKTITISLEGLPFSSFYTIDIENVKSTGDHLVKPHSDFIKTKPLDALLVESGDIVPFAFSYDGKTALGITMDADAAGSTSLHVSYDNLSTWVDLGKELDLGISFNTSTIYASPVANSKYYPNDIFLYVSDLASNKGKILRLGAEHEPLSEVNMLENVCLNDDFTGYGRIKGQTAEGIFIEYILRNCSAGTNFTVVFNDSINVYETDTSIFRNLSSHNEPSYRDFRATSDPLVAYTTDSFLTTNGGDTWTNIAENSEYVSRQRQGASYTHPTKPGSYIMKGVYWTEDFGSTWKSTEDINISEESHTSTELIGWHDLGLGPQLTIAFAKVYESQSIYQLVNNELVEISSLKGDYFTESYFRSNADTFIFAQSSWVGPKSPMILRVIKD
jgi:hypothetical protein